MKELLLSGEQTKKDVCDLYVNKGLNIRKISDIYCVSEYTVRLRLKSWGVKLRSPGGSNTKLTVTKKWYNDLMKEDGTYASIAEKYGVSAPTVSKLKNGYKPNFKKG